MKITDYFSSIGTTVSPYLTDLTKGVKTTANATSQFMDTMGGGTDLHGGFHRVCGGHSICDLALWKKYGLEYPVELAKDFITPNGLPLPGVETLVNAGHVSKSFATKWLSVNIGDTFGGAAALFDSARNIKRLKDDEIAPEDIKKLLFKGAVKGIIGAATSNPLLVFAVGADLVVVSMVAVSAAVDIDINEFIFGFNEPSC